MNESTNIDHNVYIGKNVVIGDRVRIMWGAWIGDNVEIGEGTIQVHAIGGVESTFKCDETDRLREIYESGRVPDGRDGKGLAILAPHGVLIVPCADEGKTFPRQATIAPNVVYIENGAAHYSPTTDGAWHLFSIDGS